MIKDALLTCYKRDVNPKIVRLWAKLNENTTIKVKTGVGESQKVKVGAVVGQGTIGGALVSQAVLDEGVNDKKIFFAPNGQSRVWQRCFGAKYQFLFEMVQKGPDGPKRVPNVQKDLG